MEVELQAFIITDRKPPKPIFHNTLAKDSIPVLFTVLKFKNKNHSPKSSLVSFIHFHLEAFKERP